jgi:anti-sigma regulatory factor (Ser/Thr protein kinase)
MRSARRSRPLCCADAPFARLNAAQWGYDHPMRREPPFGTVGAIERGRRFEPKPMNVRAAREFVAHALHEQGFHGDTETVLLLASELVTNAVRHAATPFEITVDVGADGVRVAVIDGDVDHGPRVRHPGPDDTSGRGLLLVDQLSAVWGSDRVGPGKAVWFTLA